MEYVKQCISDLLMNRMDLSLLVITKGLTQEAEVRPAPGIKLRNIPIDTPLSLKQRPSSSRFGLSHRRILATTRGILYSTFS